MPLTTAVLPTAWRLLVLTVLSTSTTMRTTLGAVVAAAWIAIVRTFSRMSYGYAPLFVVGIGTSTLTSTMTMTREGNDEDDDDDDDRGDNDDRVGDDGCTEASLSASSLSD